MSTLSALSLMLLILMLVIGGWQGVKNFLALMLNLLVVILAVILMAGGFAPLAVAVCCGVVLLASTIFMGTQRLAVAKPAFAVSLVVMIVVIVLVVGGVRLALLTGFGPEDSETLEGFSINIGVAMPQVVMATGLVGALGAIAEAACATAADMVALAKTPEADLQAVQTTIVGTALNTLFFGFFGGFAALFIWFAQLHYPVWEIMNNQIFVAELIQVLISVVAVVITVPLTVTVVTRRAAAGRTS